VAILVHSGNSYLFRGRFNIYIQNRHISPKFCNDNDQGQYWKKMSRFSSLYPSSQNSGSAFRPRHSGPPPFRPFVPRPPLIPGGFGPRTYRGRGLRPGGFHNQTYTRKYDADASYVDPYTEVDSANFTGTGNTNEYYTESENTNLKSTETKKITVIDYCHGAVSDVEDYRPQNTRVYGRARGYGVSRVHRSQAHLHEQTNPETHNYEETERADNSYEETATLSNEQSVFPANRGRVTLQHPPSPRGKNHYINNVPRGEQDVNNQLATVFSV
jgi:hypothetical protein